MTMENLIERMKNIFEPEIYLDILPNNSVIIREENNIGVEKSLVELKLENIPKNSIAISLDYKTKDKKKKHEMFRKFGSECFDKLSWPIRNGQEEVNKKCDFIIFSRVDETYKVLIGELKSSLDWDKYHRQLNNSRIYFEYILELIKFPNAQEISPEFNLVVFTNSKGPQRDVSDMKKFYNKRQIQLSESGNYQKKVDPYPMPLSANSGIASCDYRLVVGNSQIV